VELTLDDGGHELIELGHRALAELREVPASARGAHLLVLADLVLDPAGDKLPLLLRVLAPRLEGRDPVFLGAGRVADRGGERGDLFGALTEDVALQLLDRGLDRSELLGELRQRLALLLDRLRLCGDRPLRGVELGRKALGPLAPLAAVILAAHWRL